MSRSPSPNVTISESTSLRKQTPMLPGVSEEPAMMLLTHSPPAQHTLSVERWIVLSAADSFASSSSSSSAVAAASAACRSVRANSVVSDDSGAVHAEQALLDADGKDVAMGRCAAPESFAAMPGRTNSWGNDNTSEKGSNGICISAMRTDGQVSVGKLGNDENDASLHHSRQSHACKNRSSSSSSTGGSSPEVSEQEKDEERQSHCANDAELDVHSDKRSSSVAGDHRNHVVVHRTNTDDHSMSDHASGESSSSSVYQIDRPDDPCATKGLKKDLAPDSHRHPVRHTPATDSTGQTNSPQCSAAARACRRHRDCPYRHHPPQYRDVPAYRCTSCMYTVCAPCAQVCREATVHTAEKAMDDDDDDDDDDHHHHRRNRIDGRGDESGNVRDGVHHDSSRHDAPDERRLRDRGESDCVANANRHRDDDTNRTSHADDTDESTENARITAATRHRNSDGDNDHRSSDAIGDDAADAEGGSVPPSSLSRKQSDGGVFVVCAPRSYTPLPCLWCRSGLIVYEEVLLYAWCCEGSAPALRRRRRAHMIYDTATLQRYYFEREQRAARAGTVDALVARFHGVGRLRSRLSSSARAARWMSRFSGGVWSSVPSRGAISASSPACRESNATAVCDSRAHPTAHDRLGIHRLRPYSCVEGESFVFSVHNPRLTQACVWCAVDVCPRRERHGSYSSLAAASPSATNADHTITPLLRWNVPPTLPTCPARKFRVRLPRGCYAGEVNTSSTHDWRTNTMVRHVHDVTTHDREHTADGTANSDIHDAIMNHLDYNDDNNTTDDDNKHTCNIGNNNSNSSRADFSDVLGRSTSHIGNDRSGDRVHGAREVWGARHRSGMAIHALALYLEADIYRKSVVSSGHTGHRRAHNHHHHSNRTGMFSCRDAVPSSPLYPATRRHALMPTQAAAAAAAAAAAIPRVAPLLVVEVLHHTASDSATASLCVDHLLHGRSVAVYGLSSKYFFLHHVSRSAALRRCGMLELDASWLPAGGDVAGLSLGSSASLLTTSMLLSHSSASSSAAAIVGAWLAKQERRLAQLADELQTAVRRRGEQVRRRGAARVGSADAKAKEDGFDTARANDDDTRKRRNDRENNTYRVGKTGRTSCDDGTDCNGASARADVATTYDTRDDTDGNVANALSKREGGNVIRVTRRPDTHARHTLSDHVSFSRSSLSSSTSRSSASQSSASSSVSTSSSVLSVSSWLSRAKQQTSTADESLDSRCFRPLLTRFRRKRVRERDRVHVRFASSRLARAVRQRCCLHDPSRRCVRWLHPPHRPTRWNERGRHTSVRSEPMQDMPVNHFTAHTEDGNHRSNSIDHNSNTNRNTCTSRVHDSNHNDRSNCGNRAADTNDNGGCSCDVNAHARSGRGSTRAPPSPPPRRETAVRDRSPREEYADENSSDTESDEDAVRAILLVIHSVDRLPVAWLRRCVLPLCRRFADPHPHLRVLLSVENPHWPGCCAAATRASSIHPSAASSMGARMSHSRGAYNTSAPLRGSNRSSSSLTAHSSTGHVFDELSLVWLELRDWFLPRVHEMQHVDALTVLTRVEAGAAGAAAGGGGEGCVSLAATASGAASSHVPLSHASSSGGVMYDTMRRILFSLPAAFADLLRIMIATQDEYGDGQYISLFTHQDCFERHGMMVSQGRMRALQRELTSNRLAVYDAAEHAIVVPQHRKLLRVLQEVTARRTGGGESGTGESDQTAPLSGFADVTR